jgi:O-antigen/teichoic acid export membrane protein
MAKNLMLLSLPLCLTHSCLCVEVVILARWLGPEKYGLLSCALTVQSYLCLFSGTGLRPITVREAVQNPERLDSVITSYLVLTVAISGVLGLLGLCLVALVPLDRDERLLLGLVTMGNIASATTVVPLFDVHHQQLRSGVISLLVEIGAIVLLLGLYQSGRLYVGTAAAVFAIKWTMGMGAHFWVYHRGIRPIRLAFYAAHTRAMFRSSWPLMFSALVATVPLQAGVLVVRWLCDDASAGLLGLAQQAASAYLVFAVLGIRVLQPHLAAPRGLLGEFRRGLTLLYVLFCTLLWLGSMGAGALLLCQVLDQRYDTALNLVLLLLTAAFVNSVGGLAATLLILRRKECAVLTANLLGTLFYVGVCGFVVPRYGPAGAAGLAAASAGLATATLWLRLIDENGRYRLLQQTTAERTTTNRHVTDH